MKNTFLIALTVVAFITFISSACAIAMCASWTYVFLFASSMLWMWMFALANGLWIKREEVEEDV